MSARVRLRVSPGASRNRILGRMMDGRIKIRVAAPPEAGRANAELLSFLAGRIGIQRSQIRLRSGAGSRDKTVEIDAPQEVIDQWMEEI